MASLAKAINKSFFDSVLPTYGNPRKKTPIWDDEQRMFICDTYESGNGHMYYRGIRFCDRVVIVEKVGLYHNWTYIDSIEVYVFNGRNMELVQKKDYDKTHRNADIIREDSIKLVGNFMKGVLKMQRANVTEAQIEEQARAIVDGCYKSYLDADFNTRLIQIIPQIEQK